MEAVGFWPSEASDADVGVWVQYAQRGAILLFVHLAPHPVFLSLSRNASDPFFAFSSLHRHAYRLPSLLARLGSGVSSVVVALSVITVPAGAVTFTDHSHRPCGVWGHGICFRGRRFLQFPRMAELCTSLAPGVPEIADVIEDLLPSGTCDVQHASNQPLFGPRFHTGKA